MWLLLALCYRELRISEKHDEFLSRSRQNRSGNPTSCRGAAGKIADPDTAKGLRTLLIPPRQEQRTWNWHKPYVQSRVWVVAESSRYDYGIVFSDYGFAPECLGVCFFSSHGDFDADYCWCASLEQAYRESRLREEFDENQQAT